MPLTTVKAMCAASAAAFGGSETIESRLNQFVGACGRFEQRQAIEDRKSAHCGLLVASTCLINHKLRDE